MTDQPTTGVPAQAPERRYRAASLPLRVEAVRQLRRRRTIGALAFLVVLPFLLVGAFAVGGNGNQSQGAQQNSFVDLATKGAANFTVFTLFASTGFLLVVVVALFFGDTVASEASWGTLRYLLAAPVRRGRLLWQKMLVALGYSIFALLLLPVMALLAGAAFYGWHPLVSPLGTDLSAWTAAGRIFIAAAYVIVTLITVGAVGFWLSTVTDAPLGAVGGSVALIVVSNILDAVTALGSIRAVLPTHWQYAWTDLFSQTVSWQAMGKGTLVSVIWSLAFFGLAFQHFAGKDVVS